MSKNKQNIPKGYKQTKLGIIPEDWKLVTLNDTKSKEKWSITGGPFGSNLKVSDYVEKGGVRILQLQNIGDGKFNNKSNIRTSTKKADELLSCNIYPNDIIISKMGDPVARACFIPEIDDRYVMASDGIRLKINENEWDSKYVLDLINSPNVRNIAKRWAIGSTRQRIGLDDLRKLPFCKPPLPEQKKIAQILTTWDKAIYNYQLLIDNYKLKKKGLMQKLLAPKKDWKEVRLGDLGEFFSGGTPTSTNKEYYSGSIPFIGSGDISKKEVDSFITEEALKNSSAKIVNKGDILYALYGATSGEVALSQIQGAINQAILCIRINEDKFFIKEYLRLHKDHIVAKYLQGGQGNLSAKIIKNLKFKIPNIETQTKIANTLSSADKEIELLEKQLEKLKEQKKGLMQVLLSGQKRVKLEN